jgi:hypothetical protein
LKGEAKLWDTFSGELSVCYSDSLSIAAGAYLPVNPALLVYATGYPSCLRLVNTSKHEIVQKLRLESEVKSIVFDSEVGRFALCGAGNGCIYVCEAFQWQNYNANYVKNCNAGEKMESKVNPDSGGA